MKVWLTSFIVLLALVESSKWLQQIALPWPALLIGGAALAVISNGSVLFTQSDLMLRSMPEKMIEKKRSASE
ncbi:hypothetical protein C1752_00516 [Acaryochloris thomasi RCC1774]|uniref:Uncharacterized protein n=1 Tax=Acaryochloris thomasi RCC1774 TaxID=1764569 RepID=A0A2W1JQ99_9CYAN|nr:hypothetical protein [Acaryochloris thomasi]PZD75520.1 hypothetical protein C1752_00516 [Acaryochloris thomasi RCC1774]